MSGCSRSTRSAAIRAASACRPRPSIASTRDARARWPRAMLTTATHDTKRGEDARAAPRAAVRDAARVGAARRRSGLRLNRLTARRGRRRAGAGPQRRIFVLPDLVGAWPLDLDPTMSSGARRASPSASRRHDQGGARGARSSRAGAIPTPSTRRRSAASSRGALDALAAQPVPRRCCTASSRALARPARSTAWRRPCSS